MWKSKFCLSNCGKIIDRELLRIRCWWEYLGRRSSSRAMEKITQCGHL